MSDHGENHNHVCDPRPHALAGPTRPRSLWRRWRSGAYLRDYYLSVEPDELATAAFLVQTFRSIGDVDLLLEFGCGPTLHHIFPAVPYAGEIHMADYLAENLDAVQRWLSRQPDAHDWTAFVRHVLRCEGLENPTSAEVERREGITRRKITGLLRGDASREDPLGKDGRGRYAVVLTCYCADSATRSKAVWSRYMRNIASLVAPGGSLILAALRDATYYRVGDFHFPSAAVDEHDLRAVLERDFLPESVSMEMHTVTAYEPQGFTGILLASATKPG